MIRTRAAHRAALAAAAAAVLALVVAGYWLGERFGTSVAKGRPVALGTAEACSPVGRWCDVGGQVRVGLQLGEPVRALQPFAASVRVGGIESGRVTDVIVEFSMPGMDMGRNIYRLMPAPGQPGIWRGRVTLPVCSTGRLDWVAAVSAEAGERVFQARFPFQTLR